MVDYHVGYFPLALRAHPAPHLFARFLLRPHLRNVSDNGCDGYANSCCPLIASICPDGTVNESMLSTLDHQTGDLRVIHAEIVGVILRNSATSTTSNDLLSSAEKTSGSRAYFRIVHAGNHIPIRGSQFRVKRMQGQDIIAEVRYFNLVYDSTSETLSWRKIRSLYMASFEISESLQKQIHAATI